MQTLSSWEQVPGKTVELDDLFFPSGVLEGWRLQYVVSLNLEVSAKSLNMPLVKHRGQKE